MISESLGGVVDIGVEEFLPIGVVESGVEIVPVCVFVVPDVAGVRSLVDGVESEVGEDGAVVGNGGKYTCFGVVGVVGEEEVEEVVVAGGGADGFGEVEVLADFVETAAEWSCGGVGEAEQLSVVEVEVAEEKSVDVVWCVVGELGFEGV